MTGYKPFFPDQAYPELYADVMRHRLFKDSKTFADAIAKIPSEQIITLYGRIDHQDPKEVEIFIAKWFDFPVDHITPVLEHASVAAHLHGLWNHLLRLPDPAHQYSSLIPLPHSYVVPGGRFREIYYWDSYFTMLGLQVSDRQEIIYDMVSNFAWILGQTGQIPNGNRSYFLSRSQPPFFSLMIDLLAENEGDHIYTEHLADLLIEHSFWTNENHENRQSNGRIVWMNQHKLNKYYDELDMPRAESYAEDVLLFEKSGSRTSLYKDLRAACESGWDFSSRWLDEVHDLTSILTTQIIPADLNALLYLLEQCISRAYDATNDLAGRDKFTQLSQTRINGMNETLWNMEGGYFGDLNLVTNTFVTPSLAMMYPLFAGIATTKQAERTISFVHEHFLRPGGWVTTANHSGQQWDAPNGWAPLQWITFIGLKNYGAYALAEDAAMRWLELNKNVFERTGRMMEKYNVEDLTLEAGGGEYPVQDGFGWTNGVYLALSRELGLG